MLFWHFTVRYLACTGARVSEFRRFEVDHARLGCMDLRTKGDKIRRVYIPQELCADTMEWVGALNKEEGPLFAGKNGKVMTSRGVSMGLKRIAKRYGVSPDLVYPPPFLQALFRKKFHQEQPRYLFAFRLAWTRKH